MVVGAAEALVERARELAGSRLLSAMQGAADMGEIPECSKGALAASLGQERVEKIGIGPTALVAGASEPFVATLGRWGIDPKVAESLATLVELHAAMTLLEPRPRALPGSFLARVTGGGYPIGP